eukprot:m.149828 g.149828  ORF g.149828 m.149828 type:complete len:276 (+) comp15019_c3_seq2:307-1134(+)
MSDNELPELEEVLPSLKIVPGEGETDHKEDIPRAEGADPSRIGGDDYILNLGNQEVERILNEVEENCDLVVETAGKDAWLPSEGIQNIMIANLGYEDVDQFEDALGGTFQQFLNALPHMETKIQDDGSSVDGQFVFKLKTPPAAYETHGIKMTIKVSESKDLWRTLMKSPEATIIIPELEFEIGASVKRQIDAVYNHCTTACFNLGQHIRDQGGSMSADTKEKIADCIDQVNNLLDIPHPWDLVIVDPSGKSIVEPNEGVKVELLGETTKVADVA